MESGLPNWREILTPEALQDAGRFLSIDFFDGPARDDGAIGSGCTSQAFSHALGTRCEV